MMRKLILFAIIVVLFSQLALALQVETTPLDDDILYTSETMKYFYVYVTNDKPEYDFIKLSIEPNSDYKFADSEFSFIYEAQLHPHQYLKIPIQINNLANTFTLSYDIKSSDFSRPDSFLVMPESERIEAANAGYVAIITLLASAIMMILYMWNRFIYHSYKLDYYNRRKKHRLS